MGTTYVQHFVCTYDAIGEDARVRLPRVARKQQLVRQLPTSSQFELVVVSQSVSLIADATARDAPSYPRCEQEDRRVDQSPRFRTQIHVAAFEHGCDSLRYRI